jgi:four helix bundle protein
MNPDDDLPRFHAIARDSALECGARLDVCNVVGYVGNEQLRQGKELVVRLVAMLTKMCR